MEIEQEDLSQAIDTLISQGITVEDIRKLRNLDFTDLSGLCQSKFDVIREAIEEDTEPMNVRWVEVPLETFPSGNILQLEDGEDNDFENDVIIGPTVVGLICQGGIVIASGGLQYDGELKGYKDNDTKIIQSENKEMTLVQSGDLSITKLILEKFEEEVQEFKGVITVRKVAEMILKIAESMDISDRCIAEILIAGYEKDGGGVVRPCLAYVNKGGWFPITTHHCMGGGYIFSNVVMKDEYRGVNMNIKEAVVLAQKSICHSIDHFWKVHAKLMKVWIIREKNPKTISKVSVDVNEWKKTYVSYDVSYNERENIVP